MVVARSTLTGMRLHHEVAGSGPDVVLLHSSVLDLHQWDDQWKALTERFRVVRLDFRGHGQSPIDAEHYTDAEDVVAVMEEVGMDSARVVGSSFGGKVALELATLFPDRIERLVLLCSGPASVLPMSEALQRFDDEEVAFLDADQVDQAVALNVETWLGPEATPAVRERVAAAQRHNFDVQLAAPEDAGAQPVTVDLPAITMPAYVVGGAHDVDHFVNVAKLLSERLPNARGEILDWAGHLPNLERPQEITELLLRELA
jgi:pimeloyl-ACP methyl ester carboxylesterase